MLLFLQPAHAQACFVPNLSIFQLFGVAAPQRWCYHLCPQQRCPDEGREKNNLVKVNKLLNKHPQPTPTFLDEHKFLHCACANGFLPIAQALIQAGASIHDPNMFGNTPLHFAARNGHSHVAHFLLQRNVNPNSRNRILGQTPLHHAVEKGHTHVVACLLKHNAHPNAQDDRHQTPLHIAVAQDNHDLATYLLQHGAHKNIPNALHQTPLHIAQRNANDQLIALLDDNNTPEAVLPPDSPATTDPTQDLLSPHPPRNAHPTHDLTAPDSPAKTDPPQNLLSPHPPRNAHPTHDLTAPDSPATTDPPQDLLSPHPPRSAHPTHDLPTPNKPPTPLSQLSLLTAVGMVTYAVLHYTQQYLPQTHAQQRTHVIRLPDPVTQRR